MALRGVGRESEAESVRFHGRRVTKSGPGSQARARREIRMRGSIWPFQFGLPGDIKLPEAKTTKNPIILVRMEPMFIEPMQCKPVTALPADEKWTYEINSMATVASR